MLGSIKLDGLLQKLFVMVLRNLENNNTRAFFGNKWSHKVQDRLNLFAKNKLSCGYLENRVELTSQFSIKREAAVHDQQAAAALQDPYKAY